MKQEKRWIVCTLLFIALCWGGNISALADTYYVSPNNSSNDNAGTLSNPWRTLTYAVSQLNNGDTLFVRGGVYKETIRIKASNVTIKNYKNEHPVLDGEFELPVGKYPTVLYSPMIRVIGNNVVVDGLNVTRSRGIGISLENTQYSIVKNCNVSYCYDACIKLGAKRKDGYNTMDNCTATFGNYARDAKVQKTWTNIAQVVQVKGRHNTVKNSTVAFGACAGIEGFMDEHTIVENNVIYGNRLTQVHFAESNYATVRNNVIYGTERPDVSNKYGYGVGVDIMCELWYDGSNWDRGHEVYGNFIANTKVGIRVGWQKGKNDNYNTNRIKDVKIYNNTVVEPSSVENVVENKKHLFHALHIKDNGYIGNDIIIKNNVFWQRSGQISYGRVNPNKVDMSHNLWSRSPGDSFKHKDDPGYPSYDKLNISEYFKRTHWNKLQPDEIEEKDFNLLESAIMAIDTGVADAFFLSLDIPFVGGVDMGGKQLDQDPPIDPPGGFEIVGLALINADTDKVIRNLSKTDTVNLNQYPNINIRAEFNSDEVRSVVFQIDDSPFKTENAKPFALTGDNGQGDYYSWDVTIGTYRIKAIPYSGSNGGGSAGTPLSVTLNVVENQEQTDSFNPTEDAYLENGATRNVDNLKIQNSPQRVRESFLKFNVSGITGRNVESALLKITCAADPGEGEISVYLGGHNNWNEGNLAYSEPSKDVLVDSLESEYTTGSEYVFDVSDSINDDGEYTFILALASGGNDVSFHSSEGAVQPVLEITSR